LVSVQYFFRDGVFALRLVQDCDSELIRDWNKISPIIVKLQLPHIHNMPSQFMFCFYWIEVGKTTIDGTTMILNVFEKELIYMIDINILLSLILEELKKKDSR